MPITESWATVNNIETFYRHGGSGDPIVFLHGIPSSSFLWRKVMKELAPDFAVYAPDLPGFANSSNPDNFTVDIYSKWLASFADEIVKDKIDLVIHDMGGPLGIKFAIDHQEKINKLIIMDTILTREALPLFMRFFISNFGFKAYYIFTKRSFNFFGKRYLVNQREKLSKEALDHYCQVFLRDKKDKNGRKVLVTYIKETEREVADKITKLSIPTLVLWAKKDVVLPLWSGEHIHSQIKDSKFDILARCGHFSQEEEPELVANKIREFVTSP